MQDTETPFLSNKKLASFFPFKIFEMLFVLFSLPSHHATSKKNSVKKSPEADYHHQWLMGVFLMEGNEAGNWLRKHLN